MQAEIISIRDRLGNGHGSLNGQTTGRFDDQSGASINNRDYQKIKHRLHQTLLDRVDLESMQRLSQ